jgi:hypothetical protein
VDEKNKDKKEGQVAICADRNMFNKPGVTCNYQIPGTYVDRNKHRWKQV